MKDHQPQAASFFVAIHKDAPLPPPRGNYVALGLGGYRSPTYPYAFSDDTDDSISPRNKHYSELTGWYWIWKNVTDVDILGLCPYRRYFLLDNKNFFFFRRRKRYFQPTPNYFNYITAEKHTAFAETLLSNHDCPSAHSTRCFWRNDFSPFICTLVVFGMSNNPLLLWSLLHSEILIALVDRLTFGKSEK